MIKLFYWIVLSSLARVCIREGWRCRPLLFCTHLSTYFVLEFHGERLQEGWLLKPHIIWSDNQWSKYSIKCSYTQRKDCLLDKQISFPSVILMLARGISWPLSLDAMPDDTTICLFGTVVGTSWDLNTWLQDYYLESLSKQYVSLHCG